MHEHSTLRSRIERAAAFAVAVLGTLSVARADAPTDHYTFPFELVYDTQTKLYWQRSLNPQRGDFSEVALQCESLVAGAFDDFRVPSMKELQTLVDELRSEPPRIDAAAFPATPAELFWTSSSVADNDLAAWTIGFSAHGDAAHDAKTAEHFTRCVRP